MRLINKIFGMLVVLALMVMAASASAPAKLALTTDKNLYNYNEAPIITIRNAGNVNVIFATVTLEIRDNSGAAVYSHKFDIGVLKPNRRFAVQLLLPAGKYKAVLVYSLTGDRNKYTLSSSAFVVTPSLALTTVVNGAQDVRFTVTNPGTKPIDLDPVTLQVYTADGVPFYEPFSVSPSKSYLLQPKASINLGWGLFDGTPAGTYQGKLIVPTSSGVIVVNGDLFTVKPPLAVNPPMSVWIRVDSPYSLTINLTNIGNTVIYLPSVQMQIYTAGGTALYPTYSVDYDYSAPSHYQFQPGASEQFSLGIYTPPGSSDMGKLSPGTYYIKFTISNVDGSPTWDSESFTIS